MQNDIKTKSTDFLPQKPGSDSTSQPVSSPSVASGVNNPVVLPKDTSGPPMPTSAHVIDLKNQAPTAPAVPKTSNDFMVKNNPFMQGSSNTEDKPQAATASVAVQGADIKPEGDMPEPPMPEPQKAEIHNDAMSKVSTTDSEVKVDTTKPPSVDMAHPTEIDPKDPLKEAMISDDAHQIKKPKKKLPTWLLVIIILIAVVVIAVGTFAILNAVARPTGI